MHDYFDLVETQLGELIEQGAHRRRRGLTALRVPRMPVGSVALIGSTALAVAIAAVVVLSLHRHPRPVSGGPRVNAGVIDPSLVRNFQVLRRPLTPADRLPAGFGDRSPAAVKRGLLSATVNWITNQSGTPSFASVGLLPAQTRRTTIPGTGYSVWLIPGRHGLCWWSQNKTVTPSFLRSAAVCVEPDALPGTTLFYGPWVAVEPTYRQAPQPGLLGLVTDRVRAVMFVSGAGRAHRVPLHDGFFVSPLPLDKERLVAVTHSGVKQLYPQRLRNPPRILGSDTKVIARSSRPEVVLTGSRGLSVQVMSEMSCMTRQAAAGGSGGIIKGYQHQAAYQVPALIPLGFPTGSSSLPSCYVAVSVVAGGHTHGTAGVTIASR